MMGSMQGRRLVGGSGGRCWALGVDEAMSGIRQDPSSSY